MMKTNSSQTHRKSRNPKILLPCFSNSKIFSRTKHLLTTVNPLESTGELEINPALRLLITQTKSIAKLVKNPKNSYNHSIQVFSQVPIDCFTVEEVYRPVLHPNSNSAYCWRQDPLCFELQSSDPAVVARVREVLQYWNAEALPAPESSNHSASAPLVSTVTPAAQGYDFSGSQAKETVRLHDIAMVVRAIETDAALAIVNRPDHFLTVHGALLALEDRAVLIVGPSQSGKSTTSCALWAAGWQLLADDVSILSPDDATASPLLRRVSLRHPSRDLLGNDFWNRMVAANTCDPTPEGYVFHPDEIEGQSRARSARLGAIIFLRRLGAADPGPACLSPITPATALLALAPYTNLVHHGGMGVAISRLAPLLNQVPCFDMGRGPLPDMIQSFRALLPEEAAVEQL